MRKEMHKKSGNVRSKAWEKLMSMFLAASLILGLFPSVPALAVSGSTSGTCGDNLTWEVTDSDEDGTHETLTISGTGAMDDFERGTAPFQDYRREIQTVNLPEGLTTIGDYVFYDCSRLASINLPDSVTTIGDAAFYDCSSLASINLPGSVTTIGNEAFSYSGLTSIEIPDGVTTIGGDAFSGCSALTSIDLPDSVTAIGNYAFSGSGLTSIEIPDGVTTIGDAAFSGCSSLASINLPGSVTTIGDSAFSGCSALTSIDLPDSVTAIGDYIFSGCSALTSISLPDGVTAIGDYAFYGCSALTSISLPDSMTAIGNCAFYGSGLTSIEIPDSMTTIGDSAFSGCSALTSISLPDSMTTIGDEAFFGCSSLASINLPGSVTTIGDDAFRDSGLTSIEIPDSVTAIGNCAFYGCSSLNAVYIPGENVCFGYGVFQGCTDDLIIYGFSNSTVETYATENGITFVCFTQDARTLSVKVLTPEGGDITSSVAITWSDGATTVGNNSTLYGASEETAYTYAITLPEELAEIYEQPAVGTIPEGEGDVEETVTLTAKEKTPTLTLTGTVTAGGEPLSGAQISVTFDEGNPLTGESGNDGTFSVTDVPKKAVTVSIAKDGYYSRTTVLELSAAAESHDMGTWNMTEVLTDRIALEITRQQAAEDGSTAQMSPLPSLVGLSFTVISGDGRPITAFEIQNNSLIFLPEAGVQAGETITVTASDPAGEYVNATAAVTLDENKVGAASLTMRQKGGIVLNNLTGPEAHYMVFDPDGTCVRWGIARAGTPIGALTAGSYQVVLLQKNSLLGTVPRLSLLNGYGLDEGEDYFSAEVSVEDGILTPLDDCTVPVLDTGSISFTSTASVTASKNTAACGENILLRVSYTLDSDKDVCAEELRISLPDGLQVDDTVTAVMDNKPVSYTVDGTTVSLSVSGRDHGTLYLYCTAWRAGSQAISAALALDGGVLQPLGTAVVQVEEASLSVPTKVNSATGLVATGKAAPSSTITLYDNGKVVKDGIKANAVGSWSTEFDLAEPVYSFSYHNIYAVIQPPANVPAITTQTERTIYSKDSAIPIRITMYNTGDHGAQETVFDLQSDSTTIPYYRAWASRYLTFTFKVDFSGDNSRLSEVYVVTIDSSGDETWVATKFDENLKAWVGTHNYTEFGDMPIEVYAAYKGRTDAEQAAALDEDQYQDTAVSYLKLRDDLKSSLDEELTNAFQFGEPQVINEEDTGKLTVEMPVSYQESGTEAAQSCGTYFISSEPCTLTEEELEEDGYYVIDGDAGLWSKVEYDGPSMITYYADTKEKMLYAHGLYADTPTVLMRSAADDGTWTQILSDASGLLGLIPVYGKIANIVKTVIDITGDQMVWRTELAGNVDTLTMKYDSILHTYLTATCKNGDSRLLPSQYITLKIKAEDLGGKIQEYNDNGQVILASMVAKDAVFSLISDKFYGNLAKNSTLINNAHWSSIMKYINKMDSMTEAQRAWQTSVLNDTFDWAARGMNYGVDSIVGVVGDETGITAAIENAPIPLTFTALVDTYLRAGYLSIEQELDALIAEIIAAYSCPDDPMEPDKEHYDKTDRKRANMVIDPSGYVYEAVPSNRLEGVTATALYLGEDGQDIQWDAADYDQVNPQITGSDGIYQWDVPQGKWMVTFEKEGYQDTTSEAAAMAKDSSYTDGWLPVPPPQLEVNVGMVSTAEPEVESVTAYNDRIEVTFSQYMDIESIGGAVSLTRDGATIQTVVEALDAEYNLEGTEQYATRFSITPADGVCSGTVCISTAAANYADTKLAQNYEHTLAAPVQRPTGIEVSGQDAVVYQSGAALTVRLVPGISGQELTVENLSPSLITVDSSTVITGADGIATVSVMGNLPGSGQIRISDPLSGLSRTVDIFVAATDESSDPDPAPVEVEKVTAKLADGTTVTTGMTLDFGTKLYLSTATDGATVRYTVNDTCPCLDTALTYNQPISITQDLILRAAAVKDGVYSDTIRLELRVRAEQSGGGSGGGSGSDSDPGYSISLPSGFKDGEVSLKKTYAVQGEIVTLTVIPDKGYVLDTLVVTDSKGNELKLTDKGDGKFSFTMPASKVEISAVFVKITDEQATPFVDVTTNAYYYDAVLWAVSNGVTNGTSATTFSPDMAVSRAQMVTFLWRAHGSPQATGPNPFTDVRESDYYYDAVLWASANGVTNGTSATTFSPDMDVTRAQAVTFQWHAAGCPAASGSSFDDVASDAYYADAVAWAAHNDITNGTGGNVFSPDVVVSRAQAVTFLWRDLA